MNHLSFDNIAYGQEENIEIGDGQVNIGRGQEENIEIGDGQVNIGRGQEGDADEEQSEDSSNDDEDHPLPPPTEDTKSEDDQPLPTPTEDTKSEDDQPLPTPTEDTKSEDDQPLPQQQVQPPPPPQQQVQPDFTTSTTPPTEDAISEDDASDQSTGPVKFAFVDSFWTDYTSLGGVIASTSSESTTAQALPPVIKQEVEPGEGEAILAVVLRNKGFADATSISGSLDLPSGFRALITPEDVDSDTALASYNGVVAAGQTFTLYFRVEITPESHVGREYVGELKIRYFKVSEQEDEDTESTTLDIPFRLSGKVVLSTAAVVTSSSTSTQGTESNLSSIVSANAGVVNPLRIEISNDGSAIATGVIVNVLSSSTISSSTAQGGGDGSGADGVSNDNNNAESTTSTLAQQALPSSSSSPATMVIVGSPTFNIGPLGANEKKEIVSTIFPANTAAGTLTTLDIQLSYNDAYGNKRTLNQVLGIQISPESPQSGLNVLPTSLASLNSPLGSSLSPLTRTSLGTSSNNNTMSESDIDSISSSTTTNSSSTQPQSIQITAGSVEDLSFAIANNNDPGVSISDVVVSLTSESSEVRILGGSRWNLQSIGAESQQELSTRVYASTSLIGSPAFFTVTMQYIRNGNELRTESFQLGAIVVGDIRISVNDVSIRYIGSTPSLVGNLLNEGNTPALFTKIELIGSPTQGGLQLLRPTVSSQFLGDLVVNSPLPFNIPLEITQQNIAQEGTGNDYPISVRITYSDELRNIHELVVNGTISLESIQASTGQQTDPSSQQNSIANNGFVDAYWVDSVAASSSSTTTATSTTGNLSNAAGGSIASTLPSEREVGPGEGPSFLAVVLSNIAFSDITGIIGYLVLPEGFAATTIPTTTSATDDASANIASSQTAIASLSNIVRAGQTYTLYFRVNVLETAQIGFHEALLRINYFKVPEPEPGTYRVQTMTVPFELPGKVIFDAATDTNDLVPGEANEVRLTIRNRGSADAHSVIININAIGGSIITNNDAVPADGTTSDNGSSNKSDSGTQANQRQQLSSAAVASIGAGTFNIGTIPASGSAEIATTVYPSSSAGGTLQNLDIEILYNDANGNRRSTPLSLGYRVLPTPPEGGLSVAPSSFRMVDQVEIILASTITGTPTTDNAANNSSSNGSSEVMIIAGRSHDLNFNITNNNRNPITDLVVTLVPRSESLEIVGDSRWTLQELSAQSNARFSTRVFASESLIGSPVSFEVGVQYISGDQVKSDSFSLGGNVVGEIEIGVNDVSVRYIGDVPNLTGNLLNQGNTEALFTTIEIQTNPTSTNQTNLVPITSTPQYLGDLEDNSPLPFSIPLAIGIDDGNGSGSSGTSSRSLAAGDYPVSLRITYSDELRNPQEVILNRTVSYSPPQEAEAAPNQGFLGFGSSAADGSGTINNSILSLVFIFGAIVVAAVVIIIIVRRRSRTKKISRLMTGQEDDDNFEVSSDEYLGSSSEEEPSDKK